MRKKDNLLINRVIILTILLATFVFHGSPATVHAYQISPNPNNGTITIATSTTAENNLSNPDYFTNNGQIDINGSGTLANSGSLHNEHWIFINDSNSTLYNFGYLQNSGFIGNLGNLVNFGTLNNVGIGQIYNNGKLYNSGTIVSSTGFLDHYGSISGGGTIIVDGTFDNRGIVSPGSELGTMFIRGNYSQNPNAGGVMLIQLGGQNQGSSYDLLNITGDAQLNGKLDVDLYSGFTPTIGNKFTFLTATDGISGRFNLLDLPYGSNYWDIDYETNSVSLTYLGGTTPVPEPSTLLLLVIGLVGLVGVRRKFSN